jgi:hypothetical protein
VGTGTARINKKTIHGIVRHYWTAGSIAEERMNPDNYYARHGTHYHPYMGGLKEPTDLCEYNGDPVRDFLTTLPDGEEVEITIKPLGQSQCAKGFVWAWVDSGGGDYKRVPEADFEKMVQLEMSKSKIQGEKSK